MGDPALLSQPRVTLATPEQAAVAYVENRYVVLRGLLSSDGTATLLAATAGVKSTRTWCQTTDHTWAQQLFVPDELPFEFFCQDDVVDLVLAACGLTGLDELQVWTSIYAPGEFIGPHTDKSGTIQLLVCLATTPGPDQGGVLHIAGQEIFLSPGDAILFEAVSQEHFITPPVSGVRIVLAGRYFLT
jgi:hypothetical protein